MGLFRRQPIRDTMATARGSRSPATVSVATFPRSVYSTGRPLPSGEDEPTACTIPERSGQLSVSVQVWLISDSSVLIYQCKATGLSASRKVEGSGDATPEPPRHPATTRVQVA
ncbi:hypothetical protein OPAG_01477 [Rhodococcus opacus PD630]|nr:hypothetical protein OPAG_01477 [Rhodococcus opacus PD630]